MTHDIKSKETVTALVSFDLTVQINARPWAQVFIDGKHIGGSDDLEAYLLGPSPEFVGNHVEQLRVSGHLK